ncbi:uncharacterized protein Tco025E_06446 [Trypanosoma conorhini]|uniref:Uncharacterized protein n=1 Tax=Trypanosoma conorhini TaxID=83891 RepID=A0A422P554_9TRYP|nr:uncharacterized protein Tco025E_06446 [Trypanosoma conorhini]RNF12815.1 hypothetical protein Tco025E_06446 [Trypanosoma conorhini]
MQVVSEFQRRPNKGRLKSEKFVLSLYDVVSVVQLVCFLVYTTNFVMGCKRTFVHSVWARNDLELVPALRAKLRGCEFNVTQSTLYAFQSVSLSLEDDNSDEIFADHAVQMYLAVFFSGFTLLLGLANRWAVGLNFFSVSWRNFTLRKDALSATELAMTSLLLRATLMANVTRALLQEYLTYCGLLSHGYLPYCSLAPLFLFVSVGYFTYVVGAAVYLWNALPKYGIMTEAEAADYKVWLRNRLGRIMEARRAVEEAKMANVRLQRMIQSDAMPPPRQSAPHPATAHHEAFMSHTADVAFLPEGSASYRPPRVNMPRRRVTAAQQQATADSPMQSFDTPPHAAHVGRVPSHSVNN